MKLTGKYLSDLKSSFIEFDIDCLPNKGVQDEVNENKTFDESLWIGSSSFVNNGFSLLISFDDCHQDDIDLICEHLDDDDSEYIKDMFKESKEVRF